MRRRSFYMGVTLIELMFSVGLLGLLAGLAAPGFQASLRSAAIRSATFEVLAGLQQLRANAIVDARPGVFCPTDSAGNCVPAGADAAGWRTYIEDGGARRELGGQSLPAGVLLRASRAPLRFWPTASAASTGTLTICGGQGAAPRAIVISQTGRPRVDTAPAADCPA